MDEEKSKITDKIAQRRQDVAVQTWLAEYQALRAAILFRMRNADYSLVINIGIMGTILSLALTMEIKIALALPFISFFLGIIYFNQLRHVQLMYQYIKHTLAPALSGVCHDNKIFGWHDFVSSKMGEWSVIPKMGLINPFAFVFSGLLGLGLTFQTSMAEQLLSIIKILWSLGLLSIIALIYIWYREERYIPKK